MSSYIVEYSRAGLGGLLTKCTTFFQANRSVVCVSCATIAGFLVLRGPIKDYMHEDFVKKYTTAYIQELDPMLHEFRNCVAEFIDEFRAENPGSAELQLLEIGIGPGSSLEYFRNRSVRVIGLEPNPYFVDILTTKSIEYPFLEVVRGYSEDLSDICDESVDVVVSSLVLCSVRSLNKTLAEIQRVLKKGGRFYFYEHQACHKSWSLYLRQLLCTPLFILTLDGCRPSRFIYQAVSNNGFDMTYVSQESGPMSDLMKPITQGFATKL